MDETGNVDIRARADRGSLEVLVPCRRHRFAARDARTAGRNLFPVCRPAGQSDRATVCGSAYEFRFRFCGAAMPGDAWKNSVSGL